MKFNRKSYLFPTTPKLAVTFILFFVGGFIVWPVGLSFVLSDFHLLGFPLPIRVTGFCPPTNVCVEFNWIGLAADLFFWYLVAPAALRLFGKTGRRRNF